MNIMKFKNKDVLRMEKHYKHEDILKNELRINNFSVINPTQTKNNYNLCERDFRIAYDELYNVSYARQKDTTTFCSCILTLPKDYKGDPKEFFKAAYEIFKEIPEMKNCIGAYVHMDEGQPHMHYIFMPLEEKEKIVKKREKVFDEKKGREVSRNVEHKYEYNFNCKKLIDKEFLDNFHPLIQKKMNERGIEATIITDARIEFNRLKKEKFEETKALIEKNPDKKEKYLDEYYRFWQEINPKDYKRHLKDKPKTWRVEHFAETMGIVENELMQEIEQISKERIDKKKQEKEKEINEFEKEQDEILKNEKALINDDTQKQIDDYIINTMQETENEKAVIKKQAKEEIEKLKKQAEEEIKKVKMEIEIKKAEIKEEVKKQEAEIEEIQKVLDQKLEIKKINIFDKQPTKAEINEVIDLYNNSSYQNNLLLKNFAIKLNEFQRENDFKYNQLVDKYNNLSEKYENQKSIFDKEKEQLKNYYENIINDLKNKTEKIKTVIYKILQPLGIHKPFKTLNEEQELQSLKEQVQETKKVYDIGIKARESSHKDKNINIDRVKNIDDFNI